MGKRGGLGGKEGRTRRGRGADKEGKRGSSGKNGKILEEREEGRKETGRRREEGGKTSVMVRLISVTSKTKASSPALAQIARNKQRSSFHPQQLMSSSSVLATSALSPLRASFLVCTCVLFAAHSLLLKS